MSESAATTGSPTDVVDQLAGHIATLLAQGQSQEKVARILVEQGWEDETARKFVQGVAAALEDYRSSPAGRQALASKYLKHVGFGALWFIGGGLFTAITYGSASSGGGTYVVAYGAIIAGAIEFFWGLFGYLKHRPQ
ncbi:MAG: hypothetical protein HY906_11255 [Deltaproteobacteria bacterium]|nr:hypothetical protein [Deltaproteobacteria bacterium]